MTTPARPHDRTQAAMRRIWDRQAGSRLGGQHRLDETRPGLRLLCNQGTPSPHPSTHPFRQPPVLFLLPNLCIVFNKTPAQVLFQ